MQTAQVRDAREEVLLLLCQLGLELGGRPAFPGLVCETEECLSLVASLVRDLKHSCESRVVDNLVDSHGRQGGLNGSEGPRPALNADDVGSAT